QVPCVPAEHLGLTAPLMQEGAAILDALPPATDADHGRRLQLQMGKRAFESSGLAEDLDNRNPGAEAIRPDRGCPAGHGGRDNWVTWDRWDTGDSRDRIQPLILSHRPACCPSRVGQSVPPTVPRGVPL